MVGVHSQASVDRYEAIRGNRPSTPKNLPEQFPVGARCSVYPGDRRGEVAYVGPVGGLGTWVGVRLDEPLGDSDGTFVDNERYFQAEDKYGCFTRHTFVKVGDFPPIDLDDLLSD